MPGLRAGSGLIPMTICPEVFGEVGDQAVGADGDDHVTGLEQEPGQVGALDHAAAPLGRDRRGDGRDSGLGGVVAGCHVLDPPPAGGQEEHGLPAGAVAGQQFGQFGAAVDEDRPRREGHGPAGVTPLPGPVPAAVSLASSGASRSGASTRLPIWGRLAASSRAARPSSTGWGRSR